MRVRHFRRALRELTICIVASRPSRPRRLLQHRALGPLLGLLRVRGVDDTMRR